MFVICFRDYGGKYAGFSRKYSRAPERTQGEEQADAGAALAEFYGVTVDFVLGMTDIPEKNSYEIYELGLSYNADKKLIRRDVNPNALNLILECDGAHLLCEMISGYYTTEMSDAYHSSESDGSPEGRCHEAV